MGLGDPWARLRCRRNGYPRRTWRRGPPRAPPAGIHQRYSLPDLGVKRMPGTGRGMGGERGWTSLLPRAEASRPDLPCTLCREPWESSTGWALLAPAGNGVFVLRMKSLWRPASYPLGAGRVRSRCVRVTVGYGNRHFGH